MTIVHFAAAHIWWLIAIAALACILALVFRKRLAYLMRLAKALATDKRLPRPVRWLFGAALAIKCLPVDFGIDEALMIVGIVLLAGPYRSQWRAIRDDVKLTADGCRGIIPFFQTSQEST